MSATTTTTLAAKTAFRCWWSAYDKQAKAQEYGSTVVLATCAAEAEEVLMAQMADDDYLEVQVSTVDGNGTNYVKVDGWWVDDND